MKKLLAIIVAILMAGLILSVSTYASKEGSSKEHKAKALTKEVQGKNVEGKGKIAEDHATEANEAKVGESEEADDESAWRIPGWQTIFAIIAILYYIGFSLYILPKIASKNEEVNS